MGFWGLRLGLHTWIDFGLRERLRVLGFRGLGLEFRVLGFGLRVYFASPVRGARPRIKASKLLVKLSNPMPTGGAGTCSAAPTSTTHVVQ